MESWETGIFAFLVLACIGGAVGIYFGLKGTSESGAIGGAVGLGITAIIVVYFWIYNSRKDNDKKERETNFYAYKIPETNKEQKQRLQKKEMQLYREQEDDRRRIEQERRFPRIPKKAL